MDWSVPRDSWRRVVVAVLLLVILTASVVVAEKAQYNARVAAETAWQERVLEEIGSPIDRDELKRFGGCLRVAPAGRTF